MTAVLIDLNADVGERPGQEGLDADASIVEGVSSLSVACGFHAGDGATMQALCGLAVAQRKRIGAHVSYLDREGFGRRDANVDAETLGEQVVQQIRALQVAAGVVGGAVTYVKPHGALYNRAAVDRERANAVAWAVAAVDQNLILLGPPQSELLAAATRYGLEGVAEGFADRAYGADGQLVSRDDPGSVLSAEEAVAQAKMIATEQHAIAVDGSVIALAVRSLCLHSDTPGAAELAVRLRNALIGAGCEVRPFS
ncbi:MAG TPA: 5-oxoprolinase subunit PxpA [Solirubrobacteraceae bacterium]|nr:5-oxoprolinase subunit PxpA [Solirubrobacteraceae bacterium]